MRINQKTAFLVALAMISFFSGAVRQYVSPGEFFAQSDIAFFVLGAPLIFLWYRADSDARNYKRSALLNTSVVALALVALPYYFFRSRGAKGGFVAIGYFIVALVLSSILDTAGGYFTYYVLQS
jgi:hypothetical protein